MNTRIFVIDTNVVVSGLITNKPTSPTARVLDAMLEGNLIYLLSVELLSEYRSVLLRARLARLHGLHESEIDHLLTEITANAIWREQQPNPYYTSPDAQDNHLWALLASEPTAVLITGDQLLIKNPMPQISVISPATWAESFHY
ncbi:MAG: putative toxin-antitoxin system toxin component, PIN family [Verrucomicrobia bacterium]|nr:putative toxin-antitoxin system toxin component, PIN family [Verrucomicrobiota bacterium]MCF7708285.1 putative toxin-antitoxin system toxin component, PIN family [Verrucomicrobiota bacterium]